MEETEYEKMYQLESSYWWYIGRRRIIRSVLDNFCKKENNKIIDLGCGTGINLGLLGEYAEEIVGIDTSSTAVAAAHKRGFANAVQADGLASMNYQQESIDGVTLFDVLEHIEDEKSVLEEIHRILKPTGFLLLTVPAYNFLWSEHDIALHHYRRYNATSIRKVLEDNGFKIQKISYIICFILPLIISYRALKGLLNIFYRPTPKTSHVIMPRAINQFFINLLRAEARLLPYINFPAGSSILVLVKKGR